MEIATLAEKSIDGTKKMCEMCKGEFKINETIKQNSSCLHYYHEKCIEESTSKNCKMLSCPTCGSSIWNLIFSFKTSPVKNIEPQLVTMEPLWKFANTLIYIVIFSICIPFIVQVDKKLNGNVGLDALEIGLLFSSLIYFIGLFSRVKRHLQNRKTFLPLSGKSFVLIILGSIVISSNLASLYNGLRLPFRLINEFM